MYRGGLFYLPCSGPNPYVSPCPIRRWRRILEDASDLVFVFPGSGPGQVLRGLKSTATSRAPRTIALAFALRQLHCSLTVESTSSGKVEVSRNNVKWGTFIVGRDSRCAVALEFRHLRVIDASRIVLLEVSPTSPDLVLSCAAGATLGTFCSMVF